MTVLVGHGIMVINWPFMVKRIATVDLISCEMEGGLLVGSCVIFLRVQACPPRSRYLLLPLLPILVRVGKGL